MTFKQKFKIMGLVLSIISAIFMFLPNLKYKLMDKNYSLFDLIKLNGFKVIILFIVIFIILSICFSLVSISYDKNKYFPIIVMATSLLAGILILFIKQLSSPNDSINKNLWMSDALITYGSIITSITQLLTFILTLVITIRSFVFKKNDDEYLDFEEEITEDENEENVENEEIDEENIGDESNLEEEIFNEFNKK